MYKPRIYRKWAKADDLVYFEFTEKETDLSIYADLDLKKEAGQAVLRLRRDLEAYIKIDPNFFSSLEPLELKDSAPEIARAMAEAAKKAGVGPMAAVAGAFSEFVGRELLKSSKQVIIENGGDIFIRSLVPRTIGIYAGEESPFTGRLAVQIEDAKNGLGVCTSSGTVSHSLSFGKTDATLIISDSAALADAAATAAGNAVKSKDDIEKGIDVARSIGGVRGVLIIVGDKMGSWGEIKLV
ncbi:MAG: UPF0280 family protein [Candidatus Omnitrophota bacterium]